MAGVQNDDDFVSDINVTPFVDVLLVLLVIFMVTAPMMTEGLDVELPKVDAAEILPTENDHMILSVRADGTLFLDEYPTTMRISILCSNIPWRLPANSFFWGPTNRSNTAPSWKLWDASGRQV